VSGMLISKAHLFAIIMKDLPDVVFQPRSKSVTGGIVRRFEKAKKGIVKNKKDKKHDEV
jgi:hypothetical protein